MITRPFTTIAELRTMIDGYTKLFGCAPQDMTLVLHYADGSIASMALDNGFNILSGRASVVSCGRARIQVAYERNEGTRYGYVNVEYNTQRRLAVTTFYVTFN